MNQSSLNICSSPSADMQWLERQRESMVEELREMGISTTQAASSGKNSTGNEKSFDGSISTLIVNLMAGGGLIAAVQGWLLRNSGTSLNCE